MIIICSENSDHEIMCVYALEMGVFDSDNFHGHPMDNSFGL